MTVKNYLTNKNAGGRFYFGSNSCWGDSVYYLSFFFWGEVFLSWRHFDYCSAGG